MTRTETRGIASSALLAGIARIEAAAARRRELDQAQSEAQDRVLKEHLPRLNRRRGR